MINPNNFIVIASLPRSGSTVLQRILATDTRYSTQDETWVFPFISVNFLQDNTNSVLGHKTALTQVNRAIPDLEKALLRTAIVETMNQGGRYVIEKTPRNYISIKGLNSIGLSVILIVRNPALILASSMKNLFNNELRHIHGYLVDYTLGIQCLVEGRNNDENCLIRYEELTKYDFSSLGLSVDLDNLVILNNRIGDKNRGKRVLLQNDIKKYVYAFNLEYLRHTTGQMPIDQLFEAWMVTELVF